MNGSAKDFKEWTALLVFNSVDTSPAIVNIIHETSNKTLETRV